MATRPASVSKMRSGSSLKAIAQAEGSTVAQTVTRIDETRKQSNLSSAVRLFVLDYVRNGQMGKQI